MHEPGPSRRHFLLGAAAAAAGAYTLSSCGTIAASRYSPNSRLRIAQIGCGGKGLSDLQACAKNHDIVALCDVDEANAKNARADQPNATFYLDYRDLFDKEQLDAVVISTPDHSHAVPALIAMQLGCHVFVQKPLAHTVEEVRLLRAAASRYGVITSMGNQGTCLDGFRQAAEVVRSGVLGKVAEVHVWTDRPGNVGVPGIDNPTDYWPQGIARPTHVDPVPASFRWDLWLGPAPFRPFAAGRAGRKSNEFAGYAPFYWRGFWDFGTGAIGDMACHVANLPYFALELGAPDWIEADATDRNPETGPRQSTIRFGFPGTGSRGPVTLFWYDGGRLPPQALLPAVKLRSGGFLLVGDRGSLYSPTDYGETFELHPREKFARQPLPAPSLPRSPGIHDEWLQGILDNTQPLACFDYAAPLTEAMLLGNVALRAGKRIEWDAGAMRVPNWPDAERFLKKEYRRGFELPRG